MQSTAMCYMTSPARLRRAAGMALALTIGLCVTTLASDAAQAAEREPVKSLLEIRRDRAIVQEWDLSCGAAALATVLRYQYGEQVSEREVALGLMQREEYVNKPMLVRARQGFSLLDLKRYAEQRGYQGVGYGKLGLEDLTEHAPVIVPVNFNGYNHFVVFRGVEGNRVALADPAWGNRTMRVERFLGAWIDTPQLGRTGFVVLRGDGSRGENRLHPGPGDFVFLR